MNHKILTLVILGMLRWPATMAAQNIKVDKITIEDGLSQGMILGILQDSEDFLWFATKDGLNRYDGYDFVLYSPNPSDSLSLSGHIVNTIFEDSRGWLWIGTDNNGLNIFDRQTGKFHHLEHQPGQANTLHSNRVISIQEDHDHHIWIGTNMGLDQIAIPKGIQKNEPIQAELIKSFVITQVKLMVDGIAKESKVNCIFNLPSGDILIGLDLGVFIKRKAENIVQPWQEGAFICKKAYECPVKNIIQTSDGSILFGQNNNIYRIKEDTIETFPFPNSLSSISIRLAIGQDGTIYGTSSGLFQFNPEAAASKAVKVIYEEESLHNIPSFFIDKTGVIWLGTNGYGLIKYNPAGSLFHHAAKGQSLRQLYVDQQDRIWGWSNGKLQILDQETKQLQDPVGFPEIVKDCRWMLQDKKGDYWFHYPIMEKGVRLIHYQPKYGTLREYPYQRIPDPLTKMVEDQLGNIWMGCQSSEVMRFDPIRQTFTYFSFEKKLAPNQGKGIATALYFDEAGILWIGTQFGLLRFDESQAIQKQFQLFQHEIDQPSSLSENYILSILSDPGDPNVLWIGTKGGGLNRMNKRQGTFTVINTQTGLPNNVIYGILSDGKGQLWLSTNRGLSNYDPQAGTFDNYTSFDGLQSNEFNTGSYTKSRDGYLLFGGVNGLNIFKPDELRSLGPPPKIVITELMVNNEEVDFQNSDLLSGPVERTRQLDLNYAQNLLHFKFSALDFTVSSRNQYRYQMVGVDDHWVDARYNREVTYANLAPGKYTFRVTGTNRSMTWSNNPAEIRITIRPPWWHTQVAYLGFLLFLLLLALSIYRFQLNRIRLRNQLAFEHKEAERLAELNLMKSNFFANITHEFRTPLTLILEPARLLIGQLESNTKLEYASLIQSNAQRMLALVNQLLDLSKIESGQMSLLLKSGQISETAKDVFQSFLPLADHKDITLQWQGPPPIKDLTFDKDKIQQIISNLLSNALKFTPLGGKVILKVSLSFPQEEDQPVLHLEVQDTGIGLSPEQLARIFDRFYQVDENQTSAVTGAKTGTGIGLALVKELVNLMQGSIAVESEPGRGTTFRIDLPLQAVSDHKEWNSGTSVPSLTQSESSVVKEQELEGRQSTEIPIVLVVEDNPDLQNFIRSILEEQFQVVMATNGAEGLRKAIKVVPDLVISDVMMPIMDGYTLCDNLKNNEHTAHIPIIMLTAKSSFEHKLKGLRTGADAYLTKPFNTEELLIRIENLIAVRQKLQGKYSTQKGTSQKDTAFLNAIDNEFIKKLIASIDRRLDDESFSVENLAEMVQMSRSQMHRKLKALTNQSATEFLRNYRLDKAMELLQEQKGNVSEVAIMVGFSSQPYFSTRFKERFGFSPKETGFSSAS